MWTIGRLLKWTTEYLGRQNVHDARLSAEVLLAHATGCRRIDLYARFEDVVGTARLDRLRDWVRRAAAHEPIAYLVEEKEFFSLPFHVTRDVLIPRPETESLVECVIDHCNAAGLSQPQLFDLGTGSGCVAVALLKNLSGAKLVASDISPAALDLARENAKRHGVLDRMTLVEADAFALSDGAVPEGGFDVILSNPPYVPADAVRGLDATVREFEPHIALTDGGDGLSFYRAIASDGVEVLAKEGVVFVEIEDERGSAVIETMETAGGLTHRRTWKDRVVGRERVLMFTRRDG